MIYGSPKPRSGAVDGPFVTGGSIPDIEGESDLSTLPSGLLRIINAPGANTTFASIPPGADATVLTCTGGVMSFQALPSSVPALTATQIAYGSGTNTLTSSAELVYVSTTGTFDQVKSRDGAAVTRKLRNTSNTANSQAQDLIEVAGSSADDAWTTWGIAGGQAYSAGVDNSVAGDPYVFSVGSTLGTVAWSVNSAGEMGLGGAPVSGDRLSIHGTSHLYAEMITTSGTSETFFNLHSASARSLRIGQFGFGASGNTTYHEPKAGLAEISTTNLTKMSIRCGASQPAALMLDASVGVGLMIPAPATGTTTRAYLGGTLKTIQSDTGNVGTGEDTLHTHSLGGGMLWGDGQSIEIEAVITCAANGNNKQVKLKFGATTIADTGVLTQNGGAIVIRARVVRTGATTQRALSTITAATAIAPSYTTPAETLSGSVTISLTGEATSNDDLVAKITSIKWANALN